MITFGKTSIKPNFLFGKLPRYFKENDSYNPNAVSGYEDKGLLERYLEIFCAEIDAEVSPYIDEVLDTVDAEALSGLTITNDDDFLNLLSNLFGNPPDISTTDAWSGDETNYTQLIKHIVTILQTKGTRKSLELFLALYGYQITTLNESGAQSKQYDESPTELIYDNNVEYDFGFVFYSDYTLVITDLSGTAVKNPSQAWLDNYLKAAINSFINPIFTETTTLTYA